ncbi:transposase [Sutcliffiella horikoshii]|uniref:transposase n=1 Tax=Sutcliffiella horikoshii TaxID=79883 RepID=UPI001CBAFE68|nr:transposase [Sutcliffiella horikoshii]UAL47198.1 transposase [Sutcliffiella horikoshii]
MPRNPRMWFPGAMYHVTTRGNRRSIIFFEPKDYHTYKRILLEIKHKYPFKLHAYCLMTNHTHLLIETETTNISLIMQKINTKYAQYINRKYKLTGHLLEGRFKSSIIHDIDYQIDVSKYIHLNPVAAQMVHNPEDYPFSSYKQYLYNNQHDPLVSTKDILKYFSTTHHEGSYPQYVNTPNTRIHFTPNNKAKFLILKK